MLYYVMKVRIGSGLGWLNGGEGLRRDVIQTGDEITVASAHE